MSVKIEKKMIEMEVKTYICDVCNITTNDPSYCSCCGNMLCEKCRIVADGSPVTGIGYGDYPEKFCKQCMERAKPLREKAQQIMKRYDDDMDKIMEEWMHRKP